jgi:hypothetical protein
MAADIYTSLEGSPGAIRILQILPGSGSDELQCRLVNATLGPDISYIALSYVWKNQVEDELGASAPALPDRETVICCNGKFMKIGSNLDSALRRLRDEDTIVQLWVDMLCIYLILKCCSGAEFGSFRKQWYRQKPEFATETCHFRGPLL